MKLTPQLKPVAFNAKTTTAPVNSSFGRLPTDLQGADLEALARFNQALPAAPKGSRRLLKKPGEQDDLQALSETVTDSPEWELAQAEVGAAAAGSSGAAGTGAAAASAAEVGAAGAGGAGAAGAVSIVSPLAFVPALAVPAVGSGGGDTPRINTVPVVQATDVTGAVTELVTPEGNLTDSGTIGFTDVDLSDLHTVSKVNASEGALGTLDVSVSTGTDDTTGLGGVVTWNYSVAAAAVEYIAAGETKTETFTFNLLDGNGGSVERTVSVTITGTNDVPVVEATDVTGAVTELVTPEGNLTDSGTIAFTDVDLSDVHTVSEVSASEGALGTLDVSVSTGTDDTTGLGGIVTWNYSVAAAAVEYIAAGETKTETFTFNLLDDNGGSVERTVSVTIAGTNDKPILTLEQKTIYATVNAEAGEIGCVVVSATDVDATDELTYHFLVAGERSLTSQNGYFAIDPTTGQISLTELGQTSEGADLNDLPNSSYDVVVVAYDGHANSDPQTLTIERVLPDLLPGGVPDTLYRLSDMLAPVDEAYAYASEQVAVTVVLPEVDKHDQDDDDEVIEDARVVEIVIDDTLSVDPDGRSFDILELDAHIPSIDTENAPVLGEVGELEELGASREHDDLVVEFQAVGGPAVVMSVKQHFDDTVNGNLEYVRFAHNTTFAGYQLSSNADEVLNSCDETFSPENGTYRISNQRSALDGETLLGTSYNDLIAGSEEFTEVLSGGLGNDLLFASGDLGDTLIGGAGNDLLVLDGIGAVVQFEAAASNGLDTVVGFDATQHIRLNAIDNNQQVEGAFTFAAGSWSENTFDLTPASVVAISSLAGGDELNVRLQDLGAETLNVFALGQDNAGASLFFLVESSVGDDEANTLLYQAFDADGDGFLKGSEFTHMGTFDHAGIAEFSAANVSYMNPSFIA